MTELRIADLFCGAGGAAMGLHQAMPDAQIVGVDVTHQPHYPFHFLLGDALQFPLDGFDFVWASPPCQAFSALRFLPNQRAHPNLIPRTVARLAAASVPWAVENVPGAPLGEAGWLTMLCGTMFGLATADGSGELRRHRLIETSFPTILRPQCQHSRRAISVVGHGWRWVAHARREELSGRPQLMRTIPVPGGTFRPSRRLTISVTGSVAQANVVHNVARKTFAARQAREAMGIDWMNRHELAQAVPPAYSRFIGQVFLRSKFPEEIKR